jgi:hypothetical protein
MFAVSGSDLSLVYTCFFYEYYHLINAMNEGSHDFFIIDRLQNKHLTYTRIETAKRIAGAKSNNLRDQEKLQFPNDLLLRLPSVSHYSPRDRNLIMDIRVRENVSTLRIARL